MQARNGLSLPLVTLCVWASVAAAGSSVVPDWVVTDGQDFSNFAYDLASAGDVNGDGYDDVLVSARFFDTQTIMDAGRVVLYMGSASGLALTPAWTAEGTQSGCRFGQSVASAGDVNGDGYDDVIVGSNLFSNDLTFEGRAYLYLGSASGLASAPSWISEGDQPFCYFGKAVASAGDVDGDGYDDVLVGADAYDNPLVNEGAVFVYRGSPSGLATTPTWSASSGQAFAEFGIAVSSAGDVNDDGYDDVIVGADAYSNPEPQEGRAFLYLGSASGLSLAPVWTAESDQDVPGAEGANYGVSVSGAGDVNGDGYGDVIVGSHHYTAPGLPNLAGRAWLYLGNGGGLELTAAWTRDGVTGTAHLGHAVSCAGDVDRDGYADVVVGAWGESHGQIGEGQVLVFRGSSGGVVPVPWSCVESDTSTGGLGLSVASADVNGDGATDIVAALTGYEDVITARIGKAVAYYSPTPLSVRDRSPATGPLRVLHVLVDRATGDVRASCALDRAAVVTLDVLSAAGRAIGRSHSIPAGPGTHALLCEGCGDAPSGVYVLRARAADGAGSQRTFVLTR
jgi:hypothetical protein